MSYYDPNALRKTAATGDKNRVFYSDIIRESSLLRNETKSLMYSLSIAKPAEYNQYRIQLVRAVTWKLVKEMYDTIYAALDTGKDLAGKSLLKITGKAAEALGKPETGFEYQPLLPEAEINRIAYESASALIRIMEDKVVDEMMPSNFTKLANEQIQQQVKTKIAGGEY